MSVTAACAEGWDVSESSRITVSQGSRMACDHPSSRRARCAHRALSAVALLAMTAGSVTACSGEGAGRPDPAPSATAESTPAASRTGEADKVTRHMIDNNGHRVAFYVTEGHGPAIVLDAGGGEDASYWKDLVAKLHAATGAKIITYDRAGLGRSEPVPGPWDVASAVSDLQAGLRRLGVREDVILVAHSQAGEIATYFVRENPEAVSGAVLVDAGLPPLYTDEEIARIVAANRPAVEAAKKAPSKPANRQLIAIAESYVPMHKAYHEVSWPDAVPATVIVSEKTPFTGSPLDARRWRDAAVSFARGGPNRTLVTAKGSSHDVPKDRPALVLEEIEKMAAAQN
jgi:pimeloyl-ACP methyl ester carboxylesterase